VPRPPDPAVLERPWVAAYPPGVPPTYDLPKVALPRFLDDAARDFSDRTALITPTTAIDHGTLRDRVDAVATVLADAGVAAGERVLLLLPNHATAPVVLFAVWRLGAVAVPLPPSLGIDDLAAVVGDAEPTAILAPRPTLEAMAGQHDLLPAVAVAVDGREWQTRGRLGRLRPRRPGRSRRAGGDDATIVDLAGLLEALGDHRSLPAGPVPDDPAMLAYPPRPARLGAAVLSHANLVANAFQARLWIPDVQAGRERVLIADPLHEVMATTLGLLGGLLAAATVILLDDADSSELATAIDREQPTLLFLRPERLARLVAEAPTRRDLTSVRVCITVGGPLDPEVATAVEERTSGAHVREGFGLREASPLTHAQPVYGRVDTRSMGLPVTDTVAIVVDPDDLATPVGAGQPGMLLVSGPQVADGYWRAPEATAAAFRDGWVVTGDIVTASDDGVFRHVGRADELVHRDGTLVAPRAVEEVLERHGAIDRAAVTVLDGPALVASVTCRRRHRVGIDELLAHCRSHLDPAGVPDRIEIVDDLPMTAGGDIARDEVHRALTGRSRT
jgi:long-chain acyl-CoA synthetase